MTLERRELVGLNFIMAVVSICTFALLVTIVWRVNNALERTAGPAARLDQHCGFVRLQLAEELDWLAATDSRQKQAMAQIQFDHFVTDGWREIALCAPEGVQIYRSCAAGDVPCMTAATANAVLMTGAR